MLPGNEVTAEVSFSVWNAVQMFAKSTSGDGEEIWSRGIRAATDDQDLGWLHYAVHVGSDFEI